MWPFKREEKVEPIVPFVKVGLGWHFMTRRGYNKQIRRYNEAYLEIVEKLDRIKEHECTQN